MHDRCLPLRVSNGGSGGEHHAGLRCVDGAERLGGAVPGRASGRAVRARHQPGPGLQHRRPRSRRQRRGAPHGRGVRGGGLYRHRTELRGLRHLDARLPPLSQRRSAVERHDRRSHRGPQRAAHRGGARHDGRRPAVRDGLLAGRLRRDGDASRAAGGFADRHRLRADVGAVRTFGVWRRDLPGTGERRLAGEPDAPHHELPARLRRHLFGHDRRLRGAVRDRISTRCCRARRRSASSRRRAGCPTPRSSTARRRILPTMR